MSYNDMANSHRVTSCCYLSLSPSYYTLTKSNVSALGSNTLQAMSKRIVFRDPECTVDSFCDEGSSRALQQGVE